MNERIKQLADQIEEMYKLPSERELAIEKFAELIVDDCIRLIQISTARDPQDTIQYKQSVGHIHKIREYFGVEE